MLSAKPDILPAMPVFGPGVGLRWADAATLPGVSLLKSASVVSLMTLVSRITGLVRDLLMASTFGVSAMTDAFWVAFRIPNMLRRLFAEGAFSQAFVPVLAATKEKDGDQATHLLINAAASLLTFALLITCTLGVVGAPVLVYLLASGLNAGFDAAVLMTRWMFPYIACMSLVAMGAGVLNAWKKFAIPAATPVLLNLAMISAAWFGAPWFNSRGIEPIYAMAGGVMLGGLLQLAAILLALKKIDALPHINLQWTALRLAWGQPATKNMLKLMGPALLGVSVAQISLLINTQIASHLGTGPVTWLNGAGLLMEFPTAMLGVALGVVLMPQLAAARAANDAARFSGMIDWGLRLVVLLAVPASIGLLCLAKPLVATLFHNGEYAVGDVLQTSSALMGYGAGLIGLVAIKILTPGYFAQQNTRTPALIGIAVLVITQALNLILVPLFAHAGLALAIGLGALLNALWLLVGLLRRGTYAPLAGWRAFLLQVTVSSVLLMLFLLWANDAVAWTGLKEQKLFRTGCLALVLAASGAIYFGSLRATGLKLRQFMRR